MRILLMIVFLIVYKTEQSCAACHVGCKYNTCTSNGECTDGCKSGYSGIKCDICLNCKENKCISTGECNVGCNAGLYGHTCNQQCPTPCTECERYSRNICTSCEAGYYGNACGSQCSAHCRNDQCNITTGDCSNGCDLGYTGSKCNDCGTGFYKDATMSELQCNKCPKNCQTCADRNNCNICNQGFYGVTCQDSCSPGCPNNDCYKTDGKCTFSYCNTGYKGTKCDQCSYGWYKNGNTCYRCPVNCLACISDSDCSECSDGFFGQPCTISCSLGCKGNVCEKNSGYCECKEGFTGNNCRQCIDGKFGSNCNNDCPERCVSCSSLNNCDTCKTGSYGPTCNLPCSSGCDGGCGKNSGYCIACKDGYSGDRCCAQTSNCKRCSSTTDCSECIIGYYGTACEFTCPKNCEGPCDKNTGHCVTCKDGLFGSKCESTCSENCISCSEEGICTSCNDGFYGSKCNHPCPGNCIRCSDDASCNSCKDGYFGTVCGNKCPINCISCTSSERCYKCMEGFTGYTCSNTCHPKCKSCLIESSRYCTSCARGKYKSSVRYYNRKKYIYCNKVCSNYCLHGFCDETTGKCKDGCVSGYSGDECLCPENCKNENCNERIGECWPDYCETGYSGTKCTCTTDACTDSSCTSCKNSRWYTSSNECCKCTGMCRDNVCSDANTCLNGCGDGYYGDGCLKRCLDRDIWCLTCSPTKCNQCLSGHFPSNSTGLCTKCSQHCVNGNCSTLNGTCLEGCANRFWGENCNNPCDQMCKECDRYNGTCTICDDGKFLRTCSNDCSDRCLKSGDNALCDIDDGSCSLGCASNTYHGEKCQRDCNTTCSKQECDWNFGKCSRGCTVDYFGEWCENQCSKNCVENAGHSSCISSNGTCSFGCHDGYFGHDCENKCGENCINGTCARNTGYCIHGCQQGFEGNDCAKALEQSSPDNAGIVAGASAGAVVFLLLIVALVVVFLFIRRRKGPKSDKSDFSPVKTGRTNIAMDKIGPVYTNASAAGMSMNSESNKATNLSNPIYENHAPHMSLANSVILESDPNTIQIDGTGETADEEEPLDISIDTVDVDDTYYNAGAVTRVAVDKLAEYVAGKTKGDFTQEFLSFPKDLIKSYADSQKSTNLVRNRYKGVYPYDDNRVRLQTGKSDYINASYIDGFEKKNEYIAALGPTDKTTDDFVTVWSMIWQEKVEKSVMLTNLVENGKMKCHQYWPDTGTHTQYGDVEVTCMGEDKCAEFTVRTLSVTKNAEKRVLHHLHYTAWPDRGVPDDVTGLIEFRNKVLGIRTTLDGPTLVHCSAGVGRTGTYIALDYLTREGEETESVDLFDCVSNLRQHRVWMVQTQEQYVYLHDAVVHSLTFDSKPISGERFQEYLKSLNPENLQKKFKQLKFGQDRKQEDEAAAVSRNSSYKNKNNPTADVPGDRYRPKLHLSRTLGSCDYINAVYLNSFRAKNRYIVAQTPMTSTVTDFLTLLFQEHIPCIVDMQPAPAQKQHIGEYLPADNQQVTHGDFEVKSVKVKSNSQFILRRLVVTRNSQQGPEERSFHHFQYQDWDDKSPSPHSPQDFINWVCEVGAKAKEEFEDGKILIHCVTGAERSCLFCAVSVMLQKMESDHEVSVVNTVRQIQSRRPRAIPNKEQYLFCHQCISAFLDTFDTYSNFAFRQ